jgi:malate dehydrogenase
VGKPRLPGVKMDRRDLVAENAVIVNMLAEVMPPRNPRARWVIVSNPVDAMATMFKKVSGAPFVIATGDHPDTLRLRAKISMDLGVPVSKVEGFVGGEHGSLAFPLWSTVKIAGKPLDEYLVKTGKSLDREASVKYVRGISKQVVDIIGGTEVGPAAGFRDIIMSILQDRKEVHSCADSLKLPGVKEAVNVSVPTHVGKRMGPNLWDELTDEEHANIIEAAKAIHENYIMGMESVGKA